jgi:DNA-binding GntR family transcriptional regulator
VPEPVSPSSAAAEVGGAGTGARAALPLPRPGALPSRSESVLEAIKHLILIGDLRSGTPLVETELAERLGVSKTPVREALRTLAGSGLVTISPYKGVAVRIVDRELARAVYDMRLLVEPAATARTAASGLGDWSAAAAALDRADTAADGAERSLANRAFHRAVYAGCGNPILVKVLDDLQDQTALVSSMVWSTMHSWEQEAAEHRAILRACEAGQADVVRDLMRGHISSFVARSFPENEAD